MRKQKGFSLLELLICVAVILIIAAIAIPNLMRSKTAANESSAVASLRTINAAESTYASTWVNTGFTTLDRLGGAAPCNNGTAAAACLIDSTLSVAPFQKSGYTFSSAVVGALNPATQYWVRADPIAWSKTGSRHFYSDDTSVIRYETTNVAATVNSTPMK